MLNKVSFGIRDIPNNQHKLLINQYRNIYINPNRYGYINQYKNICINPYKKEENIKKEK